jgi:precorrin-6x reductase
VTRLIGPLRDGQVVDLRELVGKECEVVVTVESGQDGKQYAKIVDVFALEGA